MLSSPYCILTVLGKDGTPSTSSKERKTAVIKDSLYPTWDETFKVYMKCVALTHLTERLEKKNVVA